MALLGFPVRAQDNAPSHLGDRAIPCANLVYAGGKTSQCFSDRFLQRLQQETRIRTKPHFQRVHLDERDLFRYPFAVMSGEGPFQLSVAERTQLRYYVTHGGFLLASASCSDARWANSFHKEFARMFPTGQLTRLRLEHPLFRTIYRIDSLGTVHGAGGPNGAGLSAYARNGRIVMIFSGDGLNDTSHTQNCCCCGGDEINRAEFVNVDVLAYALLH